MKWADGRTYTGQWKEDQMAGEAKSKQTIQVEEEKKIETPKVVHYPAPATY